MKAALFALVLAAACAHVEGADPISAAQGERAAQSGRRPSERVLVTGSRIPRRMDAETGLPETFGPVRIYSRERLLDTGRGPYLLDALRTLDPSF